MVSYLRMAATKATKGSPACCKRITGLKRIAANVTIYEDLWLYVNFFQLVLKLVGKEQVGKKMVKRYDEAAKPYQQVLCSDKVDLKREGSPVPKCFQLNPVALRDRID